MPRNQNNRIAVSLPFPYGIDPVTALTNLRDETHPVLLHGNGTGIHHANVTILGVNPCATIAVRDHRISTVNLCNSINTGIQSPVYATTTILETILSCEESLASSIPSGCFGGHGLAVGYFGYEWCTQFDAIEPQPGLPWAEPDTWWGLYSVLMLWDHHARDAWVIGVDSFSRYLHEVPDIEREAHRLRDRLLQNVSKSNLAITPADSRDASALWNSATSSFTRETYNQAFGRIAEHIRCGDVYQVNLTQRFSWDEQRRAPVETFARLYRRNPAAYSAYLDTGDVSIHSTSPELFLQRRGKRLVTSPIKGTRERLGDDDAEIQSLLNSTKDGAEHIMIVDLERNDLGRICKYGTVLPERLRYCETLPSLHHLVTDVVGEIRAGVSLTEILKAMLPGGSITGAPKIRAMQVIRDVEPVPRGVYTGCIGAFAPGGDFTLNIAIRTVVQTHDTISFGVGGGIVADSDPDAEYAECLLKGRTLLCACM